MSTTIAEKLICGTIWTHGKGPASTEYSLPCDYHSFTASPGMLYARRLKDLINTEALSPSNFWMTHDDTWVICINSGSKKIIIPYFELLRSLFYKTSRRLTDFIFSQNPISSLCSPLIYPNKYNLFTGRYCVATSKCTSSEARLLGCLLFDSRLIYAFNMSQAYWRAAACGNNVDLTDNTNGIPIGNFSNQSFNASGYNFSHNNEKYFWAYSIEFVQFNYKFQSILYYPLDIKSKKKDNNIKPFNIGLKLPECPDVIQFTKQQSTLSEMQCCLPEPVKEPAAYAYSHLTNRRQWQDAILKAGSLPLVVRRMPWAIASSQTPDYHFSTESILINSKQQSDSFAIPPLRTTGFRKLILGFKSQNYPVKYLSLNNPKQVFGRKSSVFPVNRHSPLPISIYNRQIQRFSLLEIALTNALLYIAQPFPEVNPELVLIFIKQSLTQPTTSEWNTILSEISPVNNANDLKSFYSRIYRTQERGVSINTALLTIPIPINAITVKFCIDLADHIVDKFRRRLEFFLAVHLNYPQGIALEEQKKIVVLSQNRCRTLDWQWHAKISTLWTTAYPRKT